MYITIYSYTYENMKYFLYKYRVQFTSFKNANKAKKVTQIDFSYFSPLKVVYLTFKLTHDLTM